MSKGPQHSKGPLITTMSKGLLYFILTIDIENTTMSIKKTHKKITFNRTYNKTTTKITIEAHDFTPPI